MPSRDATLVLERLRNQQLAGTTFTTPADLVGWFGAVQSQDYPGARWALGQRIAGGSTDAAIARAFDDGAILRTHVLRPTWHFVTPADIRWLIALTGPRIERVARYYQEAVGLDARLQSRGRSVILRALGAGQHLTRAEIMTALTRARIAVTGEALGHLLFQIEADALVCSGPARGRLLTYALLDARVPAAAPIDRDRALAELARRYFQSHGPATVADYVWWSGQTASDARAGIALARPSLEREVIEGTEYLDRTHHRRPLPGRTGGAPAAELRRAARRLPGPLSVDRASPRRRPRVDVTGRPDQRHHRQRPRRRHLAARRHEGRPVHPSPPAPAADPGRTPPPRRRRRTLLDISRPARQALGSGVTARGSGLGTRD